MDASMILVKRKNSSKGKSKENDITVSWMDQWSTGEESTKQWNQVIIELQYVDEFIGRSDL